MRYQDYVIKDGKFIGEFEKMYQKFDDPWFQTKEADISYSRADTVTSIRKFGLKNILEVGCGLGYFTNYLTKSLPTSTVTGMDLSPTAVEKATVKFPKIKFFQGNLRDMEIDLLKFYDCIVFAEIMWYILEGLDDIIKKLKLAFEYTGGGILIVNQTFYKGEQQYGREFFTSQDEMIKYLGFDVLAKSSAENAGVSSYETHTVFKLNSEKE